VRTKTPLKTRQGKKIGKGFGEARAGAAYSLLIRSTTAPPHQRRRKLE